MVLQRRSIQKWESDAGMIVIAGPEGGWAGVVTG